jgi:peptide/nickel transport system substrate-binding protein
MNHFIRRRCGVLVVLAIAALEGGCRPHASTTTLTVLQSSDILTLDPNQKFEVVNDTVAMNLFDPLLRFDQHMTLQPALAVRWENPNDRTWRVHLRPGVKFHDGSFLAPDDVVFTFHRLLQHPESEMFPFLAGLIEVRSLDGSTVEFVTEHPSPLLSRLSFVYILPQKLLEREGDAEFFKNPRGTGPYRFKSWRRGNRVELQAFADYWGGRPLIPNVKFLAVESAKERWRLVAEMNPAVLLEGPRQGWEAHHNDPKLRLIARPSLTVSYLGLNTTPRPGNPLSDVRVRKAIWRSLDLKEIVRVGASNHGFVATQYVPPDVIGFNPNLAAPLQDIDGAKRLLAEAGYPNGFDLALDDQSDVLSPTVREVIRELGLAGIRVSRRYWAKEEFFDRIDKGLSDFHLTGWICSSGESAELFESSLHTREPGGGLGRDNGTGYSNPQLDRLIEQIIQTIDPAQRVELEKHAMAIAMEDLPYIPLYVQEDRYVLTPEVVWEPRADGEIWLPDVRLR